ncbi:ABC transporter ATP-binding protein [Microtetraspora fusca]|uniref:ABC transporter ATP-binding protein n=1 Tax=Microtetraspora fusca TaxID=1997 RepID=UPI00082F7E7B|nr:ABC transporter ATP-binding protein [Microtetraspora fusca]
MSGAGARDRPREQGGPGAGASRPDRDGTLSPEGVDRAPLPAAGVATWVRRLAIALSLAAAAAPGTLALYVSLTLVAGAFPVVATWLTKNVIDHLIAGSPLGTLAGLAVGLAVAGTITAALPQVTHYLRAEADRAVGMIAQDRLFAAVEGFVGLGRFENPHFLDRLRLAQQASMVAPAQAVDGALGVGGALVTLVGFLGSLLLLSPALTLLVLAAGVPTLIAEIAMSRRRAGMLWTIGSAERREIFYSQLLTSVQAAKEVRLFGIGPFLRGRMLAERSTANRSKRAVDRRETVIQTGLGLLAALVSGVGLFWAVISAHSGRISVGDVAMFVAAITGTQGALVAMAGDAARANQALLMFDHYVAVTTAGPDLPVRAAPTPLPPLRHGIEFRDVWFRYSDDHSWVLRGVNLRVPKGAAVALVGLNGEGKSTLIKLLCRFYDPTRGAILWDGVDIRDVDVAELRRRIGAVFQDYMSYDMTAGENIALGDLTALDDRDRLAAAARAAGIHDKIMELPSTFDTLLTRMFFMESEKEDARNGHMLSGGQWQRLALARAFLRDRRDLMILDEPSAGLDAEAEHEIHVSLKRHQADQTSLLVSHRLGAVRDADRIVVLSDGQIAEQGRHDELTAAGGIYARLFALQASGYHPGTEEARTAAEQAHGVAGAQAPGAASLSAGTR